ncbi:MAG: NADH-quinone oxidoreductase subunit L [Verrucomicrobia bacterium]|nr:NADH-quinone oxidoreductase subunit L [Verrucomicrobiota bacterium]
MFQNPLQIAQLVFLLPLASAAVIALALRRQGNIAALVATFTATLIAAGGLYLAFSGERFGVTAPVSVDWLTLGSFTLSLGLKFDDLSALMLSIVGVIGLCVHVFSLGYMHDDDAKARYFGGLSLFMFAMLGIVFADNLFMMFIFWELVGLGSYLLINHYFFKPSAAAASKKAFIANRVGDFGYLCGILLCYHFYGTVNLSELAARSAAGTLAVNNVIPLLLFCGAVGKSAQLPLQVWLPDAMEGPTPVSALIHAATMVAAGIFMLCRIEPLFAIAPHALTIVMWVGTATALYAALCAITQRDIKKVLAYSTLSQLGYMVAAFGLGSLKVAHGGASAHEVVLAAGVGAAMFHLTTHAFFKALMFLGSGSVIHGCHHEQDIFKMGGLSKKMPLTFVTFTLGVLAIIGCPGLAGFFSKDAILYLAMEKNTAVFAVLCLTAVLTAFYMIRMWKLVFLGTTRSAAAAHAHEGGISMTLPLIVLAVLSVVGGYEAIYGGHFDGVLSQIAHPHGGDHTTILAVSLAVMLVGAGAAFLFYKPSADDTLQTKVPGAFAALTLTQKSFDAAYDYYVAKVQQRFAMLLNYIDLIGISGIIVRGTAGVTGLVGLATRALHTGSLHAYVYWFLGGAVFLWFFASR